MEQSKVSERASTPRMIFLHFHRQKLVNCVQCTNLITSAEYWINSICYSPHAGLYNRTTAMYTTPFLPCIGQKVCASLLSHYLLLHLRHGTTTICCYCMSGSARAGLKIEPVFLTKVTKTSRAIKRFLREKTLKLLPERESE